MVMESQLYLFDEPLSNLDEELRTKLRPEILHLFHQLHVPFVYVTHDQVDAMTMGTKIAVMIILPICLLRNLLVLLK